MDSLGPCTTPPGSAWSLRVCASPITPQRAPSLPSSPPSSPLRALNIHDKCVGVLARLWPGRNSIYRQGAKGLGFGTEALGRRARSPLELAESQPGLDLKRSRTNGSLMRPKQTITILGAFMLFPDLQGLFSSVMYTQLGLAGLL